ncbi:putative Na+/Pi symporter [Pseudomonas aeruginosa]|nr:putative Na+/Pi symporter [Pseudomonas aeruginosa]
MQSSNATALLATSFVAQGLMALAPALAIMLGADVGTALMARVLTLDLSWLSPLLIFFGVIFFLSRKQTRLGQLGRVFIGLGLIILALQLIVAAAEPMTQAKGVKVLFSSLTGDIMLDALTGALFAMISYSSLAAVLLTATLAASKVISLKVALCLVVGANLGSGILAMLSATAQNAAGRRVALGSLLFKVAGCLLVLPLVGPLADWMDHWQFSTAELVIAFHVLYNAARCLACLPLTNAMASFCTRVMPDRALPDDVARPRHLDPAALDTPSLALANAVRETLRMGDTVEQMLNNLMQIIRGGDPLLGKDIRKLDGRRRRPLHRDQAVSGKDAARGPVRTRQPGAGRRSSSWRSTWSRPATSSSTCSPPCRTRRPRAAARSPTPAWKRSAPCTSSWSPTCAWGLSVFLNGDLDSAKRLRRAKQRFRLQERRYAHAHVDRLHQQVVQSIETSSLHLDLISDMKRLNSLFCAIAYAVLDNPDAPSSAADEGTRRDEDDWADEVDDMTSAPLAEPALAEERAENAPFATLAVLRVGSS